MMSIHETLFDILRNSSVNSTNWIISNTVLKKGSAIQFMGLKELADECHVSEATISRFVKLLDCQNYIEFKKQTKYLNSTNRQLIFHTSNRELNLLEKQPDEYLKDYIDQININLQDTLNFINYEQIDTIINKIMNTDRLFIFAASTSLIMAEIIQSNLASFGKIVYLGFTHKQQMNHIQNLEENDMAIVLTTYGNYVLQNQDIVRDITNAPCYSLLITENTGLQQQYYFDETLRFSNNLSRNTATYSMLFGIEYFVRRYSAFAK